MNYLALKNVYQQQLKSALFKMTRNITTSVLYAGKGKGKVSPIT